MKLVLNIFNATPVFNVYFVWNRFRVTKKIKNIFYIFYDNDY